MRPEDADYMTVYFRHQNTKDRNSSLLEFSFFISEKEHILDV